MGLHIQSKTQNLQKKTIPVEKSHPEGSGDHCDASRHLLHGVSEDVDTQSRPSPPETKVTSFFGKAFENVGQIMEILL